MSLTLLHNCTILFSNVYKVAHVGKITVTNLHPLCLQNFSHLITEHVKQRFIQLPFRYFWMYKSTEYFLKFPNIVRYIRSKFLEWRKREDDSLIVNPGETRLLDNRDIGSNLTIRNESISPVCAIGSSRVVRSRSTHCTRDRQVARPRCVFFLHRRRHNRLCIYTFNVRHGKTGYGFLRYRKF